jgi:hypothetical protein
VPFTTTAAPLIDRFPAAEVFPETVASPDELAISRIPREVTGEELVRANELSSRTVPALIPPDPVETLEVVLEIVRSEPASILAVPVVTAPEATRRMVEPLTA